MGGAWGEDETEWPRGGGGGLWPWVGGGNLPKKESRQNSQVWKWERKCGHRNGYNL